MRKVAGIYRYGINDNGVERSYIGKTSDFAKRKWHHIKDIWYCLEGEGLAEMTFAFFHKKKDTSRINKAHKVAVTLLLNGLTEKDIQGEMLEECKEETKRVKLELDYIKKYQSEITGFNVVSHAKGLSRMYQFADKKIHKSLEKWFKEMANILYKGENKENGAPGAQGELYAIVGKEIGHKSWFSKKVRDRLKEMRKEGRDSFLDFSNRAKQLLEESKKIPEYRVCIERENALRDDWGVKYYQKGMYNDSFYHIPLYTPGINYEKFNLLHQTLEGHLENKGIGEYRNFFFSFKVKSCLSLTLTQRIHDIYPDIEKTWNNRYLIQI